ncbi:alpha/beta fold hydrolase [Mycobacterium sp. CBMA271]|uniref:alpha/beta fold hydrolase n=1 Tax=unclassified Mycobacteroides TaxID=2618759 RepID=UPI0012DDBE10|nr:MULTISPECIES: alpha/beta fold hydrolase [unclassified Mycobacteroides]MUM18902.1 alpha/beta hydrolase [Mycobacteroides sp. CBMA 326]MUM23158.1 alpha/beta fold hydrolase [Mycobacteroides sp. CBMA 271]
MTDRDRAESAPTQAEGIVLDENGSGVQPPVSDRIRRAFWWLERLAPAIGSRWAVELWCTPPVIESSLRMPPGVPPSTPLEAHWDGHRIVGESWGEGPTVYLVHGWGGRRPHLGMFIKPLVASGHRVIAFDLPSHNESAEGALAPGRTTLIECAHAVAAVIQAHGPARAVVAHSLGANATTFAAAQGAPVERLVFLAPMGDFPLYLDLFAARHGFGRRIRAGLQRRLERRIGMVLSETELVRVGARTGHPPLLLIHDPDDPDTPYACSEQLVRSWPGAQLMTTRGLGRLAHFRILRHRPAITAGIEFIGAAGDRE